jgi:hypothetical protein
MESWAIVDGIQRLTAIARFIDPNVIGDKQLYLTGLEYLGDQFNGRKFFDLTPKMMRRLEETEIVIHVIRHGTPDVVKDNIFARINTGGIPLSPQELRHALIGGRARTLLKEWAEDTAFRRATAYGVSSDRMNDRELVLRFIAFRLTPAQDFRATDFDRFLGQAMRAINGMSNEEISRLKGSFDQAMNAAHAIFRDDAFRKRYHPDHSRFPINKALFEALAVNLGELSREECDAAVAKAEFVRTGFMAVMNGREFDAAVSQGTGDQAKVKLRFRNVKELFSQVIHDF